MAEIAGYVCLETVVEEINNDLYNGSRGHYFQLLKWAVRGMMKLHLTILVDKKVSKVEVLDDPYCVVLPNDFVRFHAVGIVSHTKFIPFAKSMSRTLTTTENCGEETQNTDEATTSPTEKGTTRYIPTYAYTLDEVNNRILLDGYPKLTAAVLIYQSTGINTGKATYVPIKAQEALIAWIHLQIAKHNPKSSAMQSSLDYKVAMDTWQMEVNMLGKMQLSVKNIYEVARDVYFEKLLS
jgi:hypothetical protein